MAKLLETVERTERLAQELAQARAELRTSLRRARESGETISELARRLKVSRTRIRQLLDE